MSQPRQLAHVRESFRRRYEVSLRTGGNLSSSCEELYTELCVHLHYTIERLYLA